MTTLLITLACIVLTIYIISFVASIFIGVKVFKHFENEQDN